MKLLVAAPLLCYLFVALARGYRGVENAEQIAEASEVVAFQGTLNVTIGPWTLELQHRFTDLFNQWATRIEKELSDIYRQDFAKEVLVPKVISFRKSDNDVLADLSIFAKVSDAVGKTTTLRSLTDVANRKLSNSTGVGLSLTTSKRLALSQLSSSSGCVHPILQAHYRLYFRTYYYSGTFDIAQFTDKSSPEFKQKWKNIDAKIQFGWKQSESNDYRVLSLRPTLAFISQSLTINGTNKFVTYIGLNLEVNFTQTSKYHSKYRLEMLGEINMVKSMFRLKMMEVDAKILAVKALSGECHPMPSQALSTGHIIGIVCGGVIVVAIIILLLFLYRKQSTRSSSGKHLETPKNPYDFGGNLSQQYSRDWDNNSGSYVEIDKEGVYSQIDKPSGISDGAATSRSPSIPIYTPESKTTPASRSPSIPIYTPESTTTPGQGVTPEVLEYAPPLPPPRNQEGCLRNDAILDNSPYSRV